MPTSEQYRAKAAELRATLTDAAHSPKETSELRTLEQSYTTLAENGEWMALNLDRTIQRGEGDDNHAVFPEDGERILRCLGSALTMRWNTIPTKLQRELFDCASTICDLQQTTPPKGQIARFLHNHNGDEQLARAGDRAGEFVRGKGADIDL